MVKSPRKAQEETAPAAPGLPLFYKQPSVLDAKRHAKASVIAREDYSFARNANSLGINTLEFLEASKHYPIVFSQNGEKFSPAAILGLEKVNYFVTKEGKWTPHTYVPAYARQYPFIFFENAEDKRFYLCIDEAASQYRPTKVKDASLLFNPDGTPSPLSNHALEFCTAYYQHHAITEHFCADLAKHNLLQPYHSEATLKSGKKLSLGGFFMIDEKAFNALPEATFLEFRTKGWLAFIYFALASASNWRQLLDRANT